MDYLSEQEYMVLAAKSKIAYLETLLTEALMDRLKDPNVSIQEQYQIVDKIRLIANRES